MGKEKSFLGVVQCTCLYLRMADLRHVSWNFKFITVIERKMSVLKERARAKNNKFARF